MPNITPKAAFFALTLSACATAPIVATPQERSQPQTQAEIDFVTALLNQLQPRSIAENREYCGYLGLNDAGDFISSGARRGSDDGCLPDEPAVEMRILASYHTHAAYSPQYNSEVPSYDDLEADITEGVDGYIATPGGRIWFNDASAARATLLCELTCVAADPNFKPDPLLRVLSTYSLYGLGGL